MARRLAALSAAFALALLASARVPQAQTRAGGTQPPAHVLAEARARGNVRLIVRLGLTAAPEALLTPARVGQRASIARAQASFLSRLSPADRGSIRAFTYIPYIAVRVDERELEALAALPEVAGIEIDEAAVPTLAESAPLIGATTAWASGYTGAGWSVAVLDTGVDAAHPFLAGKVIAEACYSSTGSESTSVCPGGVDATTAAGSGAPCPLSSCEHGTHVAGITAGRGSSFSGVAPDASIIAIQVFSAFTTDCGSTPAPCPKSFTSDQILALERVYALKGTHDIAAVNMSLGGSLYTSPCDGDARKAIIDQLRAAGIATVVSSGNDGSTTALSAPACISTTISAGSTTDGSSGAAADQVSSFTNSNAHLTLLAPGQTITSSVPGGGFAGFSGTSMAAPHVAGAWAVLRSRRPAATVTELADAMTGTGVAVFDPGNGLVKPRINLAAAVQAIQPACTYGVAPADMTIGRPGGSATILVTTEPGCPWSASTDAPFISVLTTGVQSGPGAVAVSIAPNPSAAPRTGTIRVGGATVVVTQLGMAAGDVNGDGLADLVWQHLDGRLATWFLDGREVTATRRLSIDRASDMSWRVAGSGDLDGDGLADLVWQHEVDGRLAAWHLSGTQVVATVPLSISRVQDTDWRIRGVGDTNGDGYADLIWQHRAQGWLAIWYMQGTRVVGTHSMSIDRVTDTSWRIAGAGDASGDGKADLVWQHEASGGLAIWFMDGVTVTQTAMLSIPAVSDIAWKIRGVGDVSGDGLADILWRHDGSGALAVWLLRGTVVGSQWRLSIPEISDLDWMMVGPG